jgi:hypothetical protein
MRTTTAIATLTAGCGLLILVGCVGGGGGPNISDYSTACMFEVNPPGSYVWSDGDTEVKPGGGATAEGAAAMNACIRRKAAEAGDPLTGGSSTQRMTVEQSAGTVTETYTYGQPPAATAPASPGPAPTGNCRGNVLSGGTGYYGCKGE